MAISGACCEAASNAHAPSSAYMPIEFVWNICIHRMPSIAPPEAPNAIPGCSTPPEAPERIVSNVTIAFGTKRQQQNRNARPNRHYVEKLNCAVARPLPMTCGTPNRHHTGQQASERQHPQNAHAPDGLAFSAHCEPRRNSAPAAPSISAGNQCERHVIGSEQAVRLANQVERVRAFDQRTPPTKPTRSRRTRATRFRGSRRRAESPPRKTCPQAARCRRPQGQPQP